MAQQRHCDLPRSGAFGTKARARVKMLARGKNYKRGQRPDGNCFMRLSAAIPDLQRRIWGIVYPEVFRCSPKNY
jgi:hypothetical protein